ncbi:MAG: hypothetical protein M0P69_11310 [Bacteroidales bacterium]|nr:hypothetical protein [Bacteroidales bacterium]
MTPYEAFDKLLKHFHYGEKIEDVDDVLIEIEHAMFCPDDKQAEIYKELSTLYRQAFKEIEKGHEDREIWDKFQYARKTLAVIAYLEKKLGETK